MPDVTLLAQYHRTRDLHKQAGKRLGPIPKARRPKYPWPIEHAYEQALLKIVNKMEVAARPIIEKYLPIIFKEAERVRGEHRDDDGHWVTINGTHVLIGEGGQVEEGPAGLTGGSISESGTEGKIELKSPLTQSEKNALGAYKSFGYAKINGLLRGNKVEDKEKSEKYVKDLDSALNKSEVKESITVYRGMNNIQGIRELGEKGIGKEIKMPTYWSASPNEKTASQFSMALTTKTGAMFEIKLEDGQKALDLTAGTKEKEVLLPRGQTYKITGFKAGKTPTYILSVIKSDSHKDEWTDDLTAMEELLRSAYGQLLDEDELEDLVENYASLTSKFNSTDLARVLSVIGGTNLAEELWHEPYVRSFIKQNVSLIKSIGTQNHDQIVDIIHRGIRGGKTHGTVAEEIFGRFDVSKSKARLIARDQIAKLNSDLSKQRLSDAGIKKYYWDTAHDERVRGRPDGLYPKARPSHWAQQGKIYDLDGPGAPNLGHPGQPIQCRCVMVPVFDRFDVAA